MIFTDKNIMFGIIGITTLIVWFVGNELPVEVKIFGSLIIGGIAVLSLTAKIDRQPSYKIFVRLFFFVFKKRSIRF
jgi:hypothetical protein